MASKTRTLYTRDPLIWKAAQKDAKKRGLGLSEYVAIALQRMLDSKDDTRCITCERIRQVLRED